MPQQCSDAKAAATVAKREKEALAMEALAFSGQVDDSLHEAKSE